jgi:hypothetical protein
VGKTTVVAIKLPRIIKKYVDASNKYEGESILACFSNDAVVRDGHETLYGKQAIEGWIAKTIDKNKIQFKPLSIKRGQGRRRRYGGGIGNVRWKPDHLDYHITIADEKITLLTIN